MEYSMKIIDLRQRTAVWHAWRAKGITASESAVILGRSPYKTNERLFAERTGQREPEDLSRKSCVQRGIAFEDHVRKGFENRHNTILLPLCVESTEHAVLRASLDGLSDDGEPVELKVPTPKTYQLLTAEGEQATAYRLAWVQVQHQLYVTDASHGWLVFDPWLKDLPPLEYRIERYDDFVGNELLPAALRFWQAITFGLNRTIAPSTPSFYF
jgi:putative phage-type endonuclease